MTDPLHGTGGHRLLYPHLAPIPEASATEAAPEANRDLSATDTLGAARAAADRGLEAPKREFLVFMPKGGGPEGMVNTLKRIQSKVQARNSCDRSGRYVVTLTDAEAAQYKNAGMRVMEDYVYHLPPPIETAEANVTPLNESVIRQVNGVERVHRELGWEGEDLLFIMIDTGIGENEFLPRPALYDDMLTAEPNDPPRDPQGHGTFGSGIAVANGNAENGEIRGVAPKATLAGMNVFEPSGGARVSTILAALDRAIEWANRDEWKDKPVVVNLSLGGRAIGDRADSPLVQMINEMVREHGIFVSAAAGNSGPGLGTISDPAWAETAMAFAASNHLGTETTADDRIEDFSSHGDPDGPPGQNDKPDIAAAGVQRVSTRSGGGTAVSSGTSFSSPEGGAAAGVLLAGAYGLHQEGLVKTTVRDMVRSMEIHDIFKETAFDMPNEPAYAEGAGDMRVYDAALLMLERHSTLNIVEREGTFRELIETLKEDDGVLDSRDQLDILTGLSKLASEITAPSERLEFLSRAREIYTAASADLAPHTVTRLASVATELACEAASELASASPLSAEDAAAALWVMFATAVSL
ncbi:MAG: S8 family serine peptidase, partial [Myxococcota bacterium]